MKYNLNLTKEQMEVLKNAINTFNKTLKDNNICIMHFEETNVDENCDRAINLNDCNIDSGIEDKKNWPEDAMEVTRYDGDELPVDLSIFNVYCGYDWNDYYRPFVTK